MHMSNESLSITLLVGLIAGWLAGQIVRGTGFGIIGDLLIGIVGAFIGSWLLPQLGIHLGLGMMSMAETNCAKWRRENVPVGLREKDLEAPVYFRASAPIYFVVVRSPSFCVLVFWLCP